MAKHSPLPWGIERTTEANWIGPMRPDDRKVDDVLFSNERGSDYTPSYSARNDANAELLVRAVNAHTDLLAALKACDDAFAAWQCGQIPGRPEDILALIARVREAIARSEGR